MELVKTMDYYKHTDGTEYQLGKLVGAEGSDYDITIITNWPDNFDDEDVSVRLIDFYFGDQDDHSTKYYVEQYIERQTKFKHLLQKLIELKATNPDGTELDEQIEFVRTQIVRLY